MKVSKNRIAVIILISMITVLSYGYAMVIWGWTLVPAWIPCVVCGFLALISSSTLWKYWHYVTGFHKFRVNFTCQVIVAFGLFLAAFFFTNKSLGKDESYLEKATVEKKYYKERHKTRRVGRRTITTGEVYYNYYLELRLEDDQIKDIMVPRTYYNRVRNGSEIELELHRGLYNFPVINPRFLYLGSSWSLNFRSDRSGHLFPQA